MRREEALRILQQNLKNRNLARHCFAVEACMRALARRFGEDEKMWGIVGLIHDADYEKTKDNPEEHTRLTARWLKEAGEDERIIAAVLSHNFDYTGENSPRTKMDWSLYCCDELTGFIVAVALVRPDRKLSSVTVESVLKKFPEKAFAAAVKREQIQKCERQLSISLPEFVKLCLIAMQEIAADLGL